MKFPRRQFLHQGAGAAALAAIGRAARAETYSARPIRLVVPFPPGGAFDTLARPWVEQVKPLLGTVVVENIAGKLRVLGVTSPLRLAAAPELPTVAEAGFPGLTNQSTIGPVAPAGTPEPIIEQIAQAVRTALAEPAYQQKLIDSGFEASPDATPEKFRRRLEADVVFWTPVVEALGLKIY